jgi:hypothetical protein
LRTAKVVCAVLAIACFLIAMTSFAPKIKWMLLGLAFLAAAHLVIELNVSEG